MLLDDGHATVNAEAVADTEVEADMDADVDADREVVADAEESGADIDVDDRVRLLEIVSEDVDENSKLLEIDIDGDDDADEIVLLANSVAEEVKPEDEVEKMAAFIPAM